MDEIQKLEQAFAILTLVCDEHIGNKKIRTNIDMALEIAREVFTKAINTEKAKIEQSKN